MRDVLRKLRHLSTSIGRQHLWMGARNYAWPLLRAVAGLYRRTLARRIRLVCVVGSYGKTTTAAAVATVLGTSHRHPTMPSPASPSGCRGNHLGNATRCSRPVSTGRGRWPPMTPCSGQMWSW